MVVQSRKAAYTLAFQVFEYEDNRGCEVTGSISSTLAAEPIYLGNLLISQQCIQMHRFCSKHTGSAACGLCASVQIHTHITTTVTVIAIH